MHYFYFLEIICLNISINLNTQVMTLVLYACMCMCVYVYTCMCMCVYMCMHVCACVGVCVGYVLRTDVYIRISFLITYPHMFWDSASPWTLSLPLWLDLSESPWHLLCLSDSSGIVDKCCYTCLYMGWRFEHSLHVFTQWDISPDPND